MRLADELFESPHRGTGEPNDRSNQSRLRAKGGCPSDWPGKNFARVGECHHKWMVPPLAFLIHADAFLLFAVSFHHRAVAFDDGQVEEAVGLLLPDFQMRFIQSALQFLYVSFTEPSTKIAGRSGIRNPLSSQSIKIRFVISSQLKMFQTGASIEQVESNIEHMIGFRIRHAKLEDRTAAIDALRDPQLPNQLLRDINSPHAMV